jgi:hypothetical protein
VADEWPDIVDVYRTFSSDPECTDPPGLIWILDWGCAIWSIVDCKGSEGQMWVAEEGELMPLDQTISDWLQMWLECRLTIPSVA